MKKFIDELIKMPLCIIVVFFQNTWKAFLVGLIFLATFLIGALTDNWFLPLITFVLICLIPTFLYVHQTGRYSQLIRKGTRTTADIETIRCRDPEFIIVKFKDESGNEHRAKINLYISSKVKKLNSIDIFYDAENPENACVPKYTLIWFIIRILLTLMFAFPFLFIVISLIYTVRGI